MSTSVDDPRIEPWHADDLDAVLVFADRLRVVALEGAPAGENLTREVAAAFFGLEFDSRDRIELEGWMSALVEVPENILTVRVNLVGHRNLAEHHELAGDGNVDPTFPLAVLVGRR